MAHTYSSLPQHNPTFQDSKVELDAEQQQQQDPASGAAPSQQRRKLIKAFALASASFLILRAGVTSVVDIIGDKMDVSIPHAHRRGEGYLDGTLSAEPSCPPASAFAHPIAHLRLLLLLPLQLLSQMSSHSSRHTCSTLR
jgi:hypothetical protein